MIETQYPVSDGDRERDSNNFSFHPAKGDQPERYETIRAHIRITAHQLRTLCPPSRELSVALTKLEEAMFWANAAIARNES
jgi:hypothetical protein